MIVYRLNASPIIGKPGTNSPVLSFPLASLQIRPVSLSRIEADKAATAVLFVLTVKVRVVPAAMFLSGSRVISNKTEVVPVPVLIRVVPSYSLALTIASLKATVRVLSSMLPLGSAVTVNLKTSLFAPVKVVELESLVTIGRLWRTIIGLPPVMLLSPVVILAPEFLP